MLAEWLRSMGAVSARRTKQFNGEGLSDVVAPDELSRWHIESKATKSSILPRSVIKKWIKQIDADCPPDMVPVIINQPNNSEWVAIMPFDECERIGLVPLSLDLVIATGDSVNAGELILQARERYACQQAVGLRPKDLDVDFGVAYIPDLAFPNKALVFMTKEYWYTAARSFENFMKTP